MIEAGLSVVGALVILEQQTDDTYLVEVVRELRADVEGGLLLSQAMDRHPKVFTRLYVSMVEAGEAAGILDQVLDRVAFQIERDTAIKRRVKGAMMYPTMVLAFATLVLIGMLLFLVPVFTGIFKDLGGELPTLTRYVVDCSDFLKHYWFIIFPGAIGGFICFRRWSRTETRAQVGRVHAPDPDEDRRRRPQGDDGALLAHALDPDRRRRRHHQGARDHRRDLRATG